MNPKPTLSLTKYHRDVVACSEIDYNSALKVSDTCAGCKRVVETDHVQVSCPRASIVKRHTVVTKCGQG